MESWKSTQDALDTHCFHTAVFIQLHFHTSPRNYYRSHNVASIFHFRDARLAFNY